MAGQVLTEQEKLERRVLRPVPKLPFRAITLLSRILYYKKLGVHFTYNIDLKPFRDTAYVVVSNHASRLDHAFTGLAFWPDTFNYVVGYNEFFRSHLAKLLRVLQVIPKKNFTSHPYAIRQILRVVKAGGRIIIMPEGMSSISGANQPCALGSGQLLKYLGVPVLYTKISGGYLTSTKYCLDERPGRVDVVVDQLFTPEQLKTMTADEIQARLDLALWHDDYAWNREAQVRFDAHGEIAKNLSDLLFWCPRCGKMLTMTSGGSHISCTACGNEIHLSETYALTGADEACVVPETPVAWFDAQRAAVRSLVARDDFLLTEEVDLGTLPSQGFLKKEATSQITGHGTLTMDHQGLHYRGTRDGGPFSFDLAPKLVPTFGMCTDVSRFYTFVNGEFLEFYPARRSAELWDIAVEENHRFCGGPWKDFPAGHPAHAARKELVS